MEKAPTTTNSPLVQRDRGGVGRSRLRRCAEGSRRGPWGRGRRRRRQRQRQPSKPCIQTAVNQSDAKAMGPHVPCHMEGHRRVTTCNRTSALDASGQQAQQGEYDGRVRRGLLYRDRRPWPRTTVTTTPTATAVALAGARRATSASGPCSGSGSSSRSSALDLLQPHLRREQRMRHGPSKD